MVHQHVLPQHWTVTSRQAKQILPSVCRLLAESPHGMELGASASSRWRKVCSSIMKREERPARDRRQDPFSQPSQMDLFIYFLQCLPGHWSPLALHLHP
ncbi:hypothetical protein MHYP_G00272000 [Metynnis hypsauchen]